MGDELATALRRNRPYVVRANVAFGFMLFVLMSHMSLALMSLYCRCIAVTAGNYQQNPPSSGNNIS